MKQRIQKVLAAAGVASRRAIEEMVQQGRVAVNGKVTVKLPIMVDPAADRITVDDQPVKLPRKPADERLVYILMNKPKGVYCTNTSQGEQRRAIDLLPPGFSTRVYPVGRLDAEAKGALLLTNDGELTHQLTHPRFGVPKTYRATVEGYVHGEKLDELKRGIWLADPKKGTGFKTGRSHITIVKRSHAFTVLELMVREARNPQIRRMLARIGHKMKELTRTQFGPLDLHGLGAGDSRLLHPREVAMLRKSVEQASHRPDDVVQTASESHERPRPPIRASGDRHRDGSRPRHVRRDR